MGRLIDTDKLDGYMLTKHGESNKVLCSKSIADVPIAYDVEAVVKQIGKLIQPLYLCLPSDIVGDFKQKLIDIVRKGGVK